MWYCITKRIFLTIVCIDLRFGFAISPDEPDCHGDDRHKYRYRCDDEQRPIATGEIHRQSLGALRDVPWVAEFVRVVIDRRGSGRFIVGNEEFT